MKRWQVAESHFPSRKKFRIPGSCRVTWESVKNFNLFSENVAWELKLFLLIIFSSASLMTAALNFSVVNKFKASQKASHRRSGECHECTTCNYALTLQNRGFSQRQCYSSKVRRVKASPIVFHKGWSSFLKNILKVSANLKLRLTRNSRSDFSSLTIKLRV